MVQVNIYIVLLFFTVVCVVALAFSYFGAKIVKGLSPKSMYNVATCLVIASIISVSMSLWAVCIALPNAHQVDYTHQDVIVDILGILVTILMGWNIISVVDFKNRTEKLESKVEKRLNKIDSLSSDFDHVVSGIMKLNMYSFPLRGDKAALIDSCFISLDQIVNCEDEKLCKAAINQNMLLLIKIFNSFQNEIQIFEDKRNAYLYILDQIPKNKYKADILDYIKNAKGIPSKESDIEFMYDNINKTVDATSSQDNKSGAFEEPKDNEFEASERTDSK